MTTITIKISENRTQCHIQTDRPSREADKELRTAIGVLEKEISEMPASHFQYASNCKVCGYSGDYHPHSCPKHPRYTI